MTGIASLRLIGRGHASVLCIVDKDKAPEVSQAIKTLVSAAQSPLELKLVSDTGQVLAHEESSTVPARRAGRW